MYYYLSDFAENVVKKLDELEKNHDITFISCGIKDNKIHTLIKVQRKNVSTFK